MFKYGKINNSSVTIESQEIQGVILHTRMSNLFAMLTRAEKVSMRIFVHS